MRTRRDKRLIFVLMGVFVAAFSFAILLNQNKQETVDAADLSKFEPGNIISDYMMSNYNSMTEAEIQAFLTAKNPCDNTNYSQYQELTRLNGEYWHWKDNHFVCISEEKFGEGTDIGEGETAAHIIYSIAQAQKINPQVLLVLLEKESGLISDRIPNSYDYRKAVGYGCYDSEATCRSEFYGFKNQLTRAAKLFREVLDGGWTNYPLGENYVQYNPDTSCGGTIVNIQNLATSSLYRYTPYQPNAAALAAGYGQGDYCSAYGNRNFYQMFYDWFGDPKLEYAKINIAEGVYYINSTVHNGKVLDVFNANTEDGTNIQIYDMNKTNAQKWKIKYNKDTDDFSIFSENSGKSIDVFNANTEDGTNIQLWKSNNTCAQRWNIVKTEEDKVAILSSCSNKAITIDSNQDSGYLNVEIRTFNNSDDQEFKFVPVNNIEEGIYTITTSLNQNVAMDISGGVIGANNGTNIQTWANNHTGAQRWKVTRTKDGYYIIKNLQSNKVVDASAKSTKSAANIWLWEENNTCAQKWQILKNFNESYTFISACSNKVLEMNGYKNGDNIELSKSNNKPEQQWLMNKIDIIENSIYNIISSISDEKGVDVFGNYNANGTNIQLWKLNGTEAQKWKINYDGKNDYYTIINPDTLKALDVENAGTTIGTNIHLWKPNNTCAQQWIIYGDNEGWYTLLSACSNMALDVENASDMNGTNIQLWKSNNTNAQKWKFKKIE